MSDTELMKITKAIQSKEAKGYIRMMRVVTGAMRLKVLMLLAQSEDGMTVTDLATALGGSLSRISHQVGILKRSGLVKATRDSRNVIYSLTTNHKVYRYASLGRQSEKAEA